MTEFRCVTGQHAHRTEGGWHRCVRSDAAKRRRARVAACRLGREHGRNAAEWWAQEAVGGRATGDVRGIARRIIAGLDDGDPEILDGLPWADLSGEWADGMTPRRLAEECGWPDEPPMSNGTRHDAWDDWQDGRDQLCDLYEGEHDDTVRKLIVQACGRVLS